MNLSTKEWATLEECAHALASLPGALPKDSIKRELLAAIHLGKFECDECCGVRIQSPLTSASANQSPPIPYPRDLLRRVANSAQNAEWRSGCDFSHDELAQCARKALPHSGCSYRDGYIDHLELKTALVRELSANEWATPSGARSPAAQLPLRDHALKSSLRQWYRDGWVDAGQWRQWLMNDGRSPKTTPSAKDDLAAARERFGNGVSRKMIRDARRDFAPSDWTRPGARNL